MRITQPLGHRPRFFAVMVLGLGLAVAPAIMAHAAGKDTSAPTTSHATTPKTGSLHGYKTEAEAKAGCLGDTVVWRASGSKAYHTAGSKYFGKTKHGNYVCEKAAKADGLHLSKS